MSDEAATAPAVPEVSSPPLVPDAEPDPAPASPAAEAPAVIVDAPAVTVATGGHTALGHALYIFGVVTAIVVVISVVMWARSIKHTPKPKAPPVAVIVHEPEIVKQQERVEPVAPVAPIVEPVVPPPSTDTPQSAEEPAAPSIEVNEAPARTLESVEPIAPEPAPHAARKRVYRPKGGTYRPRHVVTDAPRETGFWARFMRAAAAFAQGPSK